MDKQTPSIQKDESGKKKRGAGRWAGPLIALGAVCDCAFFLGTGWSMGNAGPVVFWGILLILPAAAAFTCSYGELLIHLPRLGTVKGCIDAFCGPSVAAGAGWASWFGQVCLIPAAALASASCLQIVTGNLGTMAYLIYTMGFMAALTILNGAAVDVFPRIQPFLSALRGLILLVFCLAALGIWTGIWGSPGETLAFAELSGGGSFLGTRINWPDQGPVPGGWLPYGVSAAACVLIIALAAFRGVERTVESAALSEDPEKMIPSSALAGPGMLTGAYLIPVFFVLMVFPVSLADDRSPVMAEALRAYGLDSLAVIIALGILAAVFSGGNTGFYRSVFTMYEIAGSGGAPAFLGKLSRNQTPAGAAAFTLISMWVILIAGLLAQFTGRLDSLFALLLITAGMATAVSWAAVIFARAGFHRRLKKNGYRPHADLKNGSSPAMDVLSAAALILIAGAVILPVFDPAAEGTGVNTGLLCLLVTALITLVPGLVCALRRGRSGRGREEGETSGPDAFEEQFPRRTGEDFGSRYLTNR